MRQHPSQPSQIGPYRIDGELGAGGMGVVYRATHVDTGRVVALKTVKRAYGSVLAGLRLEIHALTRMRHPGIVEILEEGTHDGLPWYAMELLEGRTLEDVIQDIWRRATASPVRPTRTTPQTASFAETRKGMPVPTGADTMMAPADGATASVLMGPGGPNGPIGSNVSNGPSGPGWTTGTPGRMSVAAGDVALGPRLPAAGGDLPMVLTLVRRLCAPLSFMHGLGIVHRDLKPANVFVRPDGTPVLMDFGLVSRSEGAVGREVVEVAGDVRGTAAYISPEQVNGQLVDARCDLYALGVMLYQLVTGRFPFNGDDVTAILHAHLHADVTPPSALVDGVPDALERLILRLLARERRDRLGHADDVAEVLASLGAAPAPAFAGFEARAYLYRPELAGRTEVVRDLTLRLDGVRRGRGEVVLVGGESGVGKTYLAAAIARAATLRGMCVITGECIAVATPDAGEVDVKGAPLHPFRHLFQAIADHCREKGQETADRIVGPHGKVLAAFEPSLRWLPGQGQYPEPPEVPAQAARRRILVALAEVLRAFAAERALLLILDDLQWADELSLSFLASIRREHLENHRVFILGTYRSEEVNDALSELLGAGVVRRVDLSRLDEATVGTIVGDMLAMPAPPPDFVRVLARRSEGNPFFVAEYLRTAVAERLLDRRAGRWQVASAERAGEAAYEALPLPRSLRELVGHRLDGLGDLARAIVEVAAVLGREFDGELLIAVAGIEQQAALAPIKDLLARQVFEEVRAGRFRFVHDKLREIAYERVPVGRRGGLHHAAARTMEERYRDSEIFPLLYSELAHHFTEAGDLPQAIDYLERAAAQAQKTFANREAVAFLADALALDSRAPSRVPALRRAAWERQIGNAYLGLGKLVDSQQHLEAAVALLGYPMPGPPWRVILGLLGQLVIQVVHRIGMPDHTKRTDGERAVLLEAARAYDLLMAVTLFLTGALPRILYATLANLNLSERAGPSPELALAYANAQVTTGLVPWIARAEDYGRKMQEILKGVTDPSVVSWAYVLTGSYKNGIGRCEEAIAWGRKAEAIAEEVGFRRRYEEGVGVQGAATNLVGDFKGGRDNSRRIAVSAERGDQQSMVWGLSGQAQNVLMLGDAEAALRLAEQSRAAMPPNPGQPEEVFVYGVLAACRLACGDEKGAREAAEKGQAAIARGAPTAFYAINAYSLIAEVFLTLWERSRASTDSPSEKAVLERRARQSVRDVRTSAKVFLVHRPRASLYRGRYAEILGDHARARRLYEQGAATARGMELAYEAALLDVARAALLGAADPSRRELLSAAQAVFQARDAVVDLARVDALLRPAERAAAA